MPIYAHYLDAVFSNISLVQHLANIFLEIYSDTEIDYIVSLLTQKVPEDETQKRNSIKTAAQYFEKTYITLQTLMRMLGIEFYFYKLRKKYQNSNTLHVLLLLMSRCRKLYSAIHHLSTTFRLINKRLVASNPEPLLDERLRCSIKAFFNEHTLLPLQFVFGGKDILKLVRKRKWSSFVIIYQYEF